MTDSPNEDQERLIQAVFDFLITMDGSPVTDDLPQSALSECKLVDGRPVFTLRGLFSALQAKDDRTLALFTFQTFQQALYQSDLNARLRQRGRSVTVYDNTGKVASNWYQLADLELETK